MKGVGTCQCIVQLAERHDSSLDVLAVIKMLLRLLVALLKIDFDSDHLVRLSVHDSPPPRQRNSGTCLHIGRRQTRVRNNRRRAVEYLMIRIRQPRLIRQRRRDLAHLALVPGLLLQLSDRGLLGSLTLVDQSGRELDAHGFDRRAVLEDDHGGRGLVGVPQDGRDGHGVYAAFGAGFAGCCFPYSLSACLVGPS